MKNVNYISFMQISHQLMETVDYMRKAGTKQREIEDINTGFIFDKYILANVFPFPTQLIIACCKYNSQMLLSAHSFCSLTELRIYVTISVTLRVF
jgi:hypothetical protein